MLSCKKIFFPIHGNMYPEKLERFLLANVKPYHGTAIRAIECYCPDVPGTGGASEKNITM